MTPFLGGASVPDAMLGQSYLYVMHARLLSAVNGKPADVVREIWEYQILPQLIESLRAHGAEDLLDEGGRGQLARGSPPRRRCEHRFVLSRRTR